jgi:hypothetical protein
MRSWVDFPDPSDHSTMIRVPGRSSAEKNISRVFSSFAVGTSAICERGDFLVGEFIRVDKWRIPLDNKKNRYRVNETGVFWLVLSGKDCIDTYLYTEILGNYSSFFPFI